MGGGHDVGAFFVLLDLLKGDGQMSGQILLRHARLVASGADALTYLDGQFGSEAGSLAALDCGLGWLSSHVGSSDGWLVLSFRRPRSIAMLLWICVARLQPQEAAVSARSACHSMAARRPSLYAVM